jgi:hypothetical protein
MIEFMENNIDDNDDSSRKFMKYFIFQIWIMLIFVSSLVSKTVPGFTLLCNIGIRGLRSMANFVK